MDLKEKISYFEGELKKIRAIEEFSVKQEKIEELYQEFYEFCLELGIDEETKKLMEDDIKRRYMVTKASSFYSKMNNDIYKLKIENLKKILSKIKKDYEEEINKEDI